MSLGQDNYIGKCDANTEQVHLSVTQGWQTDNAIYRTLPKVMTQHIIIKAYQQPVLIICTFQMLITGKLNKISKKRFHRKFGTT